MSQETENMVGISDTAQAEDAPGVSSTTASDLSNLNAKVSEAAAPEDWMDRLIYLGSPGSAEQLITAHESRRTAVFNFFYQLQGSLVHYHSQSRHPHVSTLLITATQMTVELEEVKASGVRRLEIQADPAYRQIQVRWYLLSSQQLGLSLEPTAALMLYVMQRDSLGAELSLTRKDNANRIPLTELILKPLLFEWWTDPMDAIRAHLNSTPVAS